MTAPAFKIPTDFDPSQYTIAVVDDEEDIREILIFQLKRKGFKVLEAENGELGYQLVKTHKVDMVISDIQMPVLSGVQMLGKIRSEYKETPVVLLLTGFGEVSVEDAYKKGAELLLAKPFDLNDLIENVCRILKPSENAWKARPWRGDTALKMNLTMNGNSGTGLILNLSEGGFFVELRSPLPEIGTVLSFRIPFTDGAYFIIEGSAVVRWCRDGQVGYPQGCGVEFQDISSDDKKHLYELVNYLKTKQHIF